MATIKYEQHARNALVALLDDPTRSPLAGRVRVIVAMLKENPNDIRLRRERFTNPIAWIVRIYVHLDEAVLLWSPDPTDPEVVNVIYFEAANSGAAL